MKIKRVTLLRYQHQFLQKYCITVYSWKKLFGITVNNINLKSILMMALGLILNSCIILHWLVLIGHDVIPKVLLVVLTCSSQLSSH